MMNRKTFSVGAEDILGFFYDISRIPRQSGNNKAISDYLMRFAARLNLPARRDEAGNVVICKPAQEGYEDTVPVIIQAHYDMVCEKEAGCTHDFYGPLKLCREGDRIFADRTSLGADNGIGVAAILALLAGDAPHPALEAVFTSSEETDMAGARGLDVEKLEGKLLLSMDSHALLCCGAGELEVEVRLKKQMQAILNGYICREIKISGLRGGHTGSNAMEEPGNAITLLNRILLRLRKTMDFDIVEISGGSSPSSFPREAGCIICYEAVMDGMATFLIDKMKSVFCEEYGDREPGLRLDRNVAAAKENCLTRDVGSRLIQFLTLLPEGICSLNHMFPGTMESCAGCGVILTNDEDISLSILIRSTCASRKYQIFDEITLLCEMTGAQLRICHDLPQWDWHVSEPVMKLAKEIYWEKEPEMSQGTLECGIFQEKNRELSILGTGIPYYYQHSPSEYILVGDIRRYWSKLQSFLRQLKDISY